MKNIYLLLATVLLCGCESSTLYKLNASIERPAPLAKSSRVFVGVSPETHAGGSLQSALAFSHAARGIFADLQVGNDAAEVKANVTLAAAAGSQYLFLPRIIATEDNATAWSGKPDRLVLQVTTIDIPAHKAIDVGTVQMTGPWWTPASYAPDEFLQAACTLYLKHLTGVVALEGTVKNPRSSRPKPVTAPSPKAK